MALLTQLFARGTRVPEPRPVSVLTDDVEAEYAAVATRVGYTPRDLPQQQFRRYLSERGICVYDRSHVTAYLDRQFGRMKTPFGTPTWGWRALRERDNPAREGVMRTWGPREFGDLRPSSNGTLLNVESLYSKPVPLPVLLTVEAIQQAFPAATFWVSDEVQASEMVRDPFLLVAFQGEHYIVERWDEPSFRG